MITLRVLRMCSGTLPSGETVTLHTGNERAFDESDARWLLSEYPDRFERVADPTPPQKEIETFGDSDLSGAQARGARERGKTKKG